MRLSPEWGKLAIQSEIESAMSKFIHLKLNETKSVMGQVSHPERDRRRGKLIHPELAIRSEIESAMGES